MKKIAFPLLIAASLFACNKSKPDTTAPEAVAQQPAAKGTTYGTTVSEAEVLPAAALAEAVAGKDSLQATVAAEVVESCQAKGCWMDVKLADNRQMKVTFRDYGFFLPVENLEGRQVIFTGTAKREMVSVEDQRHFAEDAGKSASEIAAITAPKEELRFVADGVILK
ncbi:DUF4920 domain-containing protein [Pontibacter akesuensis]|uniref:DUF4920 domain-containing protein n=1 Tax=Pontibacter akesuensis TaxID=388950 RepID=A0A1I7FT35_9BACT|nr:DUF4920 domain-containing protein [Pontibacter akesuensis]GHA60628.1 hypothetical protein GCM10007389_11130 [Pontibacter akesuensis]SFU39372.1 protein of unknown function [Pontibacter akesuensis]